MTTTSAEARKPRRKRFNIRVARVEYIDMEVLAQNQIEADDAADYLANVSFVVGSDYIIESECFVLSGTDIERPHLPGFDATEQPGPVQANDGHVTLAEHEKVYNPETGRYRIVRR